MGLRVNQTGVTPGYSTTSVERPSVYRINERGIEDKMGVTIRAASRDSGNTTTTTLRKGLVLGRTATGTWMEAANANVVKSAGAFVRAQATAPYKISGGATLLLYVNGIRLSIAIPALASGTIASAVNIVNSQINILQQTALAKASASGNFLVIRTKAKGSNQYISVGGSQLQSAANSKFFKFQSGTKYGTDGAYGILVDAVSVLNETGTSQNVFADVDTNGVFDSTYVYGITGDAKKVLMQNGSVLR